MSALALDAAGRRRLRRAGIAAIVAALAGVLLLAVSGWFLTAAALAGAAGPVAALGFNYLIPSAAIRGLAILRTVGRYGERLFSHQAALGAMASLRAGLFARLAAQDGRTGPDLAGGDASARLIGDIDALEELIVRRPVRPASWVAAGTGVLLAGLAGWAAALALALLLAALPPLLDRAARRLTHGPAQDAGEALGALRTRYVEYAAARAEVAAYGLAGRVTGDLSRFTAALDAARARLHRGEGVIAALLAGYAALAVALVLLLADAPAPRVALALLAAAGAVEAMAGLARTAFRRAGVAAGLRRLDALLALPEPVAAPVSAGAVPLRLGSLDLAPGARVAITGRSGSGKTLLLETLAGLRAGTVDAAIGGQAPAACSGAMLRAQFALAPQDAALIAGTIADNLRLARPGVDKEAIWAVLRVAALEDRIQGLPQGLNTRLGEAGGTLSGGERKRLSLARALLAGRPWLLLDEPTEGLDSTTESEIIARLDAWLAGSNTGLILVSHRRAPLTLAGNVIAIEDIAPSS
ncbi:MAG: ATP-binding cassette domain-containing protein [Sphingomonas sp.]|uniref:ATP-binding cassette domain-containing protein n=1 Tax=Sphingomonas sp. TaxID=28214 RepID=UPI0025F6FCEC|nr:ATP-binding cassette domain-containing protein [Sphingomonas sp.]MBQ1499017.1 ATP-binding cassette domain-containing protein [Sphingomonas sp.]